MILIRVSALPWLPALAFTESNEIISVRNDRLPDSVSFAHQAQGQNGLLLLFYPSRCIFLSAIVVVSMRCSIWKSGSTKLPPTTFGGVPRGVGQTKTASFEKAKSQSRALLSVKSAPFGGIAAAALDRKSGSARLRSQNRINSHVSGPFTSKQNA